MKFIHISDLHLGKRVKNFSMIEEQEDILEQILGIVLEEQPDAVLIAGDVYDKPIPSGEAMELFDDFLVKLCRSNTKVFVISGNHDSPERIAFASRLLEYNGIYLSPVYRGEVTPIVLTDAFGPVHIYLMPFVKPVHVKRYFPEEEINDYTDAMRVAIAQMQVDPAQRNILVAHQFVTGAKTCDSEVTVGGLDNVNGACFEAFDYVALGHIHTPQPVHSDRIRYCGTPLKYSFSEVGQEKSVTVAELGAKGELKVSTRPLSPKRDFIRETGLFEDIMEKHKFKPVEDYAEVVLLDEMDVPEAFRRLLSVFPNLMQLSYDNKRTREKKEFTDAPGERELTELELIEQLYVLQNNQPLSDMQRAYLEKLIDEVTEE